MKIFISSVISGMEDFRDAVAEAIDTLSYDAVRSEDFNASPESSRIACLEGVRSSDALILIVGERYGDQQASGLSATHEEYKEARETHRPVIVMVQEVQEDVIREALQNDFLQEIRDWQEGLYTGSFGTRDELFKKTIASFHQIALQNATGPIDSNEIIQRALAQLSQRDQLRFYEKIIHQGSPHRENYFIQRYYPPRPYLALALTCGPRQSVLRPAQMESSDLSKRLLETALYEPASLFTPQEGTDKEIENDVLVLMQKSRFVRLNEHGSISYAVILPSPAHRWPEIIEKEVREQIDRFIQFANEVLNYIDDSKRLSHCVIAALLLNANDANWRTLSSQEKNLSPMTIQRVLAPTMQTITLSPPIRTRAELRSQRAHLVEDLTILLRREFHATST